MNLSTSRWRVIRRRARQNPLMVAGLVVCVAWVLISLGADWLAPADPMHQSVMERLQAPSTRYPFGTDQLGRDVLSRVLYGGRASLPAGLLVIASATLVGTVFGALAGYVGGMWDELLMRFTEIFMAFPIIILAMAIAAALGPSVNNAVIAMSVVWWPNYARVVRSLVISVKSNEYVTSARAIGASPARILFTVLPSCLAPAVVMATLDIGNAILICRAELLGLGPDPLHRRARMVSDGIDHYDQWWQAFQDRHLHGHGANCRDGLRDLADPRTRAVR